MSGTEAGECSQVKVHYDFEYNANDGRRIVIKKDEILQLVQKTNKDWWKVVRDRGEQFFYVPATYITEIGGTSPLQENVLNGPDIGSQGSSIRDETPIQRAAKRQIIEKWLSSTANVLQDGKASEDVENIEDHSAIDSFEIGKSQEIGGDRHRAAIDDHFYANEAINRRRLGFTLENREIISEGLRDVSDASGVRSASNSPQMPTSDLLVEGPVPLNFNRRRESFQKANEAPRKFPYDRSNSSPDYVYGSSKRRGANVEVKSSPSIAKGSFDSGNVSSSSVNEATKILNDKRKSWAVEELMSELTQLRKERVDTNKTNFVLRSVQIKDRFDPLEKLTEELYELHASQSLNETNFSEATRAVNSNAAKTFAESNDTRASFGDVSGSSSPKSPTREALENIQGKLRTPKKCIVEKSPKISALETKSNADNPQAVASRNVYKSKSKRLDEYEEANILNADVEIVAGPELYQNDSDNRESSLSAADNESPRQSAYHVHSQLSRSDNHKVDNFEEPSYSNVSINLEGKPKLRPKLKLTINNIDAKIKLTPSLEKLASEIEFLPASRTSVPDSTEKWERSSSKSSIPTKSDTDSRSSRSRDPDNARRIFGSADDALNVSEEKEMWKNFKSKLNYKSSFTSNEGEKGQPRASDAKFRPVFSRDDIIARKSNLKKSATFHGGALPQRRKYGYSQEDLPLDTGPAGVDREKRRSRSAENIRALWCADFRFTKANPTLPSVIASSEDIRSREKNERKLSSSKKMSEVLDKSVSKTITKSGSTKLKRLTDDLKDPLSGSITEQKTWPEISSLPSVASSYPNINEDESLHLFDRNKSTAVSFKNLLCTSESGSDEYLQYKPFPKSPRSKNERESSILDRKPKVRGVASIESLDNADGSVSDKQISSANISSEALFSQSESEVYALSDLSNTPSPVTVDNRKENFVALPPGWTQEFDPDSKQICFINSRREKWFSSNDADGKIYFYEENSNESSWILPSISINEPDSNDVPVMVENVELRPSRISTKDDKFRFGKARSMVVGIQNADRKDNASRRSGSVSQDWPQLHDGNMCILKEGILHKTKITENGKRIRKNWSTSYVVLSELLLLFFKDAKTFALAMSREATSAKPEVSVDLNGATIEPGGKASSRKNVYVISTALGLQLLIQSDNATVVNEWYQRIRTVISNLPSGPDTDIKSSSSLDKPGDIRTHLLPGTSLPEESTLMAKIGRSRSLKIKGADGSMEDLSGSSVERQTKLKAKLKRFFQRRPNMDILIKNGIYKDEPAFGSYLEDVSSKETPRIPPFVKECIRVLEDNPENMKADGLYRASGNLSQIQKIRLQVDQNNLDVLRQEEDVHVLTGALKLFFRELKEPLLPYTCFTKALTASVLKRKSDRVRSFREIVQTLPPAHHDTLQFLLQHLLRVVSFQEFNRMHIHNLAIVFGPTLMWPAVESANIAVDLMQQNNVMECLLSEYKDIFESRNGDAKLRT